MPVFAGGIISGLVLAGIIAFAWAQPIPQSWAAFFKEWGATVGVCIALATYIGTVFNSLRENRRRKDAALAALGVDLSAVCAYAAESMKLAELLFNVQEAKEKLDDYRYRKTPSSTHVFAVDQRLSDNLDVAKQAFHDFRSKNGEPAISHSTIERIANSAAALGEKRLSDVLNTYQIQRARLVDEAKRFEKEGPQYGSRFHSYH